MTRDLLEFAGEIYDTVADPNRWTSVLDRLADELGARGCIVFEMSGEGPDRALWVSHSTSDYEAALLSHYIETFRDWELADQDIFEAASLETDGVDLIDDSVLATSDAALMERPNVKQLMKYGIRHRAAGLLDKDNRNRSRFSVQLGEVRLTGEQRALLGHLLPHIAKALDMGRAATELAALRTGLLTAMDRLNVGVCVVDDRGNVVTANTEFQRQREEYRAFRIEPSGQLALEDSTDRQRFQTLLKDTLAHGRHGARPRKEAITTATDAGVGALCIEIAPLAHVAELGSTPLSGAVIYSLDTSKPVLFDPDLVAQVYGLTSTEAQLTQMVSEGLTNVQIAERRARSVETVNAQVKAVLGKTQCANRTQLVRMLSGFGASLLRPGT